MNYHGAIDLLMWHCKLNLCGIVPLKWHCNVEKGFGIEAARWAEGAFPKTEFGH